MPTACCQASSPVPRRLLGIERLGEVGGLREALARFGRQAFGEQVELRVLGAGLGDGMGDGDHVVDAGTAWESGQWRNYRRKAHQRRTKPPYRGD